MSSSSLARRVASLEGRGEPLALVDHAMTERLRRAHERLGLEPFTGHVHRFYRTSIAERIQAAEKAQEGGYVRQSS